MLTKLSCSFINSGCKNVRVQENLTPLHFACAYGHVNTAHVLINHGARADVADSVSFMLHCLLYDRLVSYILIIESCRVDKLLWTMHEK